MRDFIKYLLKPRIPTWAMLMLFILFFIVTFAVTTYYTNRINPDTDLDTRPALKSARYQEMDAFIANNPIPGAGDVTVWVYRDRETGREIFVSNKGSVVIGDAAYTTSTQEVFQP